MCEGPTWIKIHWKEHLVEVRITLHSRAFYKWHDLEVSWDCLLILLLGSHSFIILACVWNGSHNLLACVRSGPNLFNLYQNGNTIKKWKLALSCVALVVSKTKGFRSSLCWWGPSLGPGPGQINKQLSEQWFTETCKNFTGGHMWLWSSRTLLYLSWVK